MAIIQPVMHKILELIDMSSDNYIYYFIFFIIEFIIAYLILTSNKGILCVLFLFPLALLLSLIFKKYFMVLVIALQVVVAQLPNSHTFVAYYTGTILSLAIIVIIANLGQLDLQKKIYIYISILCLYTLAITFSQIGYSSLSTAIKDNLRFLCPFIVFIMINILIKDYKFYINYLRINYYSLGFLVIVLNFIVIFFGYKTGIPDAHRPFMRNSGLFELWHSLSYFSYTFFFLASIYYLFCSSRKEKILIYVLLALSVYLIVKAGTRTVMLGFFIYLCSLLMLSKKYKKLLLMLTFTFVIVLINKNTYNLLVGDLKSIKGKSTILSDSAGSGRGMTWKRSLAEFKKDGLLTILGGRGAHQQYYYVQKGIQLDKDAHNDYLAVLYQYGILGLLLVLLIYSEFLIKSWQSIHHKIGPVLLAGFISILCMCVISNAIISRPSFAIIMYPVFIPLINKDILYDLSNL
jgi:hypothetical protein